MNQIIQEISNDYSDNNIAIENNIIVVEKKEGILINDIRDVKSFLMTTSVNNAIKIAIIEDIHNMTINAGVALLKTLEDAPISSLIILTTASLYSVPITIRSRCIKIHVSPQINVSEILKQHYPNLTDKDIDIAIEIADGSIGTAKQLLSNNLMSIIKICQDIFINNKKDGLFSLIDNTNNKEQVDVLVRVIAYLIIQQILKYQNDFVRVQEILDDWQQKYTILSHVFEFNMSFQNIIIGLLQKQSNILI